jgi:hypothetical protein
VKTVQELRQVKGQAIASPESNQESVRQLLQGQVSVRQRRIRGRANLSWLVMFLSGSRVSGREVQAHLGRGTELQPKKACSGKSH